jgi:hypothetical protein
VILHTLNFHCCIKHSKYLSTASIHIPDLLTAERVCRRRVSLSLMCVTASKMRQIKSSRESALWSCTTCQGVRWLWWPIQRRRKYCVTCQLICGNAPSCYKYIRTLVFRGTASIGSSSPCSKTLLRVHLSSVPPVNWSAFTLHHTLEGNAHISADRIFP